MPWTGFAPKTNPPFLSRTGTEPRLSDATTIPLSALGPVTDPTQSKRTVA